MTREESALPPSEPQSTTRTNRNDEGGCHSPTELLKPDCLLKTHLQRLCSNSGRQRHLQVHPTLALRRATAHWSTCAHINLSVTPCER